MLLIPDGRGSCITRVELDASQRQLKWPCHWAISRPFITNEASGGAGCAFAGTTEVSNNAAMITAKMQKAQQKRV